MKQKLLGSQLLPLEIKPMHLEINLLHLEIKLRHLETNHLLLVVNLLHQVIEGLPWGFLQTLLDFHRLLSGHSL